MTAAPLVDVTNLHVRRGAFGLRVPRWSVFPGRVVGVVGSNGAGKSTLLETITGLLKSESGHVEVLGHDPLTHPVEVRSRLGYMTDDMPLFAMRVGKLLHYLCGYYPTWDGELVQELVDRFQLDVSQRAAELSKGQGTRLRLITAMAFRPALLVLDEPATGLDAVGKRRLLQTVLEYVADPARSVVVSSHLLTDLERVADELLVLNRGAVVAAGEASELVPEGRTLEEMAVQWAEGP